MQTDDWSLRNEWLNDFSQRFVCDTHRLVREITIENEVDCVVVRGCARSYYAVQLAIYTAQTFSRQRPCFAATRLALKVNDRLLELRFTHQVHRMRSEEASTRSSQRPRALTLA